MDSWKWIGQIRALFHSLLKSLFPRYCRTTLMSTWLNIYNPHPNPLRIPEQPSEHAPWGFFFFATLSCPHHTLDPILPGILKNTAGNGPASHLPQDMISGSIYYTVCVRKTAVGKLLCLRGAKRIASVLHSHPLYIKAGKAKLSSPETVYGILINHKYTSPYWVNRWSVCEQKGYKVNFVGCRRQTWCQDGPCGALLKSAASRCLNGLQIDRSFLLFDVHQWFPTFFIQHTPTALSDGQLNPFPN